MHTFDARRRRRVELGGVVLLALWGASCSSDGTDGRDTTDISDTDVDAGGSGTDDELNTDEPGADDPNTEDPSTDDPTTDDPNPDDPGAGDGGTHGDGDGEPDGGLEPMQVLQDYLPCDKDGDCPVGFGDCVREIPFNVPDSSGSTAADVTTVFGELTSQGICTRVCTNGAQACDGLVLTDARGRDVPYSCQLVTVGASPYPAGHNLPFEVDDAAMAAGVAFGAVCRPPFELHPEIPGALCNPCTSRSECGDGVCYDLRAGQTATVDSGGTCLMQCADSGACPGGFSCETLSDGDGSELGKYCRPLQFTCGACRDDDRDGRGVGHCGANDELTTAVDCDDQDPSTFFDPVNPNHPFPGACAERDSNCNGVVDSVEVLSQPGLYGDAHCGECGAGCSGPVSNGTARCLMQDEAPFCGSECQEGWADCDDQPGCETAVTDPERFYYPDSDGDAYGDPAATPQFACDDQAPAGTVPNSDDCDDTNPDVHPGATEQCNAIDDDCSGSVDDDFASDALAWYADQDGDGYGTTDDIRLACAMPDGFVDNMGDCDDGNEQQHPAALDAACDGMDDDCDGVADDGFVPSEQCDANDAALLYSCVGGELVCECRRSDELDIPGDGADSNCDGFDGDVAQSIFLAPGTTPGCSGERGTSRQLPCEDLAAALDRAEAEGKALIASVGRYSLDATLHLRDGVNIHGGFDFATGRLSAGRTTLQRVGSGHHVVVAGTGITSATLLQNVMLEALSPAQPGMGTYGLVCSSCSGLVVEEVLIALETAAAGAPGVPGMNGYVGARGGNRSGRTGGAGAASYGKGGKGGTAPSTCWPGDDSVAGAAAAAPRGGKAGTAGSLGPGGSVAGAAGVGNPVRRLIDGFELWLIEGVGGSGTAGLDGGGGGGGLGYCDVGALPGSEDSRGGGGGGGGGQGAGPGSGGGAGGSSIGLVLFDSKGIELRAIEINLRSAGNGGSGGNGGNGGNGGSGGSGSGSAKNGAAGARGGGGSGGGGGPGGSLVNIVVDAATTTAVSSANITRSFTLNGAAGGQGGIGGNNNANSDPVNEGKAGQAGQNGFGCDVYEVQTSGQGTCLDLNANVSTGGTP